MKIHEALIEVNENHDYWCRPVKWKGSGEAFCLIGKKLMRVPSIRMRNDILCRDIGDLVCDWEVLNPTDVLNEG